MERVQVVVQGRVQGVYYRASTRDRARQLGLHGWVWNCPDGSVEILAEGDKAVLSQFVAWCWQGPPAAVVTQVTTNWHPATGEFVGFNVKY